MSKSSFSILIIFTFIAMIVNPTSCISFIELFGLQSLVQDLVKATPTVHYTGQQSVSYAVDDRLLNFLKNFETRTSFCDYKCPHFYSLPCFILFQCNIQIRNFVLIIVIPITIIGLIGLCCGRGIWTFGCWAKYIGLVTGIFFIVWFLKKFVQGYETIQRRKREKNYIKQQRERKDIDIEPVFTEKRLNQPNQ